MEEQKAIYIQMVKEGASYEEVRTAIKADGWNDDDTRFLMSEVDDAIWERVEDKAVQHSAREWMLVGGCIFWVCLIMLLYSFKDPTSRYIYLVYFGLFGGGMIFLAGRRKRRYGE